MLHTLKAGQHYLKTWLLKAELGAIFPENRIIKATRFAQKFMPFMAVFALVWQQIYAKHDSASFSIAILTALFALFIPLQGLYWLGKRAASPLEPQTAIWFFEICERLKKRHEPLIFNTDKLSRQIPTYQDLAQLLRLADQKLEKEFWKEI